jgi:protein tyrosine phosphatase (PTP) superfamily phosphohydrolase (DUF442 family)
MRHPRVRNWFRFGLAVIAGMSWLCAAAAEPLPATNIHNVFRATPKIISGSSPDNEAGFAEIARLGVKTIISVDGGKPDVEAARKHGLKYIHLPIGYDGIPSHRVVELVKAAQTAEGPIYVHCHHGLHRGPAAVALMCEAVAGWSTKVAEQWLKTAGTSPDYPGLYRNAREFKAPTAAELAAVKSLPEVAQASSIVDAMVAIDEHFARLKAAQKTAWKNVPGQPDISPAHEATLLWEQLREMARLADTAKRPEDYRVKLADSEKAADQFRVLLKSVPPDTMKADEAFRKVGATCAACHQPYRN